MIRQAIGRFKTGIKAATGFRYDALDLLRSDHMKVEVLAIRLRVVKDPSRRMEILKSIREKLDLHMRIEEEIFYPECSRIPTLREVIDRAHTDHQLAKNVLKDLEQMDPSTDRYTELVTKLILKLEAHVYQEENRIFSSVRRHMGAREYREMSRRMLEAAQSRRSTERAA